MKQFIDSVWQLARLALMSKLKLRGAYWKWRADTAFGTNPQHKPPRLARAKAVLDYGAWVGRMRRIAARSLHDSRS